MQLWGEEVSLSFEFLDKDLMTLWADYSDPEEEAIKKRYGKHSKDENPNRNGQSC